MANDVGIEIRPVDGVGVAVILHTNGAGHVGKGDNHISQLCGVQRQPTHVFLGGKQQERAYLCKIKLKKQN